MGNYRVSGSLIAAALLFAACSTAEKKEGPAASKSGGGGGGEVSESKGAREGGGETASGVRVTMTNSLSNSQLTSQVISVQRAEQELARFSGGKGEGSVIGVISTQRLARKSSADVLASAKKLAELESEKGAGKSIPPEVKLEIALAALQSHNFALAEYYLQELTDAKNTHVKAGAYNALGVVALRDDRVPEAVLYFREALKAVGNYKPALLNLGFAALKGGDLATAKQSLSKVEGDWFVKYGLITVERIEGDVGGALEKCDTVLKKEPDHAGALFNCALLEYQNKHNVARAKEYLNRAGKAKNTEQGWGERAFMLVSQIDVEEAKAKQDEAKAKADKAAADKAAADKAKGAKGGGGAAPAGGGGAAPPAPKGESTGN